MGNWGALKRGWQLSLGFSKWLTPGCLTSPSRAKDQAQMLDYPFGFAPWDSQPFSWAWLLSRFYKRTQVISSGKSAPLQWNHLHGIVAVGTSRIFSICYFFVLFHILVLLAILAHSWGLSDDSWQWWGLSFTSQRHQIMPKHPVLNRETSDYKDPSSSTRATADNSVSTLSCFLTNFLKFISSFFI